MAGFFPLFFEKYWSTTESVTLSTLYLGLANSIASIIVAALAPFLGAIADRGTAKKKFLTADVIPLFQKLIEKLKTLKDFDGKGNTLEIILNDENFSCLNKKLLKLQLRVAI